MSGAFQPDHDDAAASRLVGGERSVAIAMLRKEGESGVVDCIGADPSYKVSRTASSPAKRTPFAAARRTPERQQETSR